MIQISFKSNTRLLIKTKLNFVQAKHVRHVHIMETNAYI